MEHPLPTALLCAIAFTLAVATIPGTEEGLNQLTDMGACATPCLEGDAAVDAFNKDHMPEEQNLTISLDAIDETFNKKADLIQSTYKKSIAELCGDVAVAVDSFYEEPMQMNKTLVLPEKIKTTCPKVL
jgi:hypothetical protein